MKKLVSVLVLLAMLLAVLAACSDGTKNEQAETTAHNDKDTTGEVTENPYLLPNKDFDGYVFRWLDGADSTGIVVDEGEVVDDTSIAYQARIERDSEIIDRFNISFADVQSDVYAQIHGYVIKDALNPESSFDGGLVGGGETIADLILGDILFDVKKMPYLNLDQEWYQKQANDEFTIVGKQYVVAGAYPTFIGTCPFFFNKDMVEDANLPLPYDTILAGEWTLEEMEKYTSVGYQDTNEAVPGPDKGDIFGYAGHPYSVAYFYQGMNGKTTIRNEVGEVVPVFSNDTIDAIYSKLNAFYIDSGNYTKDTDTVEAHKIFFEGRAMFCYWVTGMLKYTEIDTFERGLAILPKYDVDQEDYACPSYGGNIFPANLADEEITGYLYEALCEATQRIVYPAKIQEAVDFEELTDEGSIEVQKIMDRSLVFDILKNCDPTNGQLASCGFILACFKQNTTPSAQAPAVKGLYEKMFADFFSELTAD